MSSDEEEELPEAPPRSDVDYDTELEVEAGTLVWRDPEASGDPISTAYVWPLALLTLIVLAAVAALV
jgi:hypothetical protein